MKISSISPAKITQSSGLGRQRVRSFTFKKTWYSYVHRMRAPHSRFLRSEMCLLTTHVPMCRHFAEASFLCKKNKLPKAFSGARSSLPGATFLASYCKSVTVVQDPAVGTRFLRYSFARVKYALLRVASFVIRVTLSGHRHPVFHTPRWLVGHTCEDTSVITTWHLRGTW